MASTYLTITPSGGSGRTKWTWSAWIKRTALANQNLWGVNVASQSYAFIGFRSDKLRVQETYNGGETMELRTTRLFRDTNAWYHIVVALDTTQATASERLKIYINGVQETVFDVSTYPPSQNYTPYFLNTNTHVLGRDIVNNVNNFEGCMSHVHVTDGYVYDASAFGETDATTGIWKPKTAPSVTYGTNGFFLKFENSGAFGTDSSGNGNNFTVNGTMTQTIDTPSNVFATLNPLVGLGSLTLSNGNLTCGNTTTAWDTISSTIGASSGKWYSEYKWDSTSGGFIMNGIISIDTTIDNINSDFYIGQFSTGYGYYSDNGSSYNNGSASAYGNSYTVGDIIGIAMDLDNSKLYFSKNGTWQNSGDPTSGATGTGAISITSGLTYAFGASNRNSAVQSINYGNGYFGTTAVSSAENPDDGIGIFEYDVPTGYRALCTKSINAEEYD